MPITIITDSASDIEQGELHNVRVLPMTVTIDGVPYSDGVDITKDEFYRLQQHPERGCPFFRVDNEYKIVEKQN